MSSPKRIVISGMAVNTPLGDTLDTFYQNLIAGQSAISGWKFTDPTRIYSKVGADLSTYDTDAKLVQLADSLPADIHKRLRRLVSKAPFSTRLGVLCAASAYLHAGITNLADPTRAGVIVSGHNLTNNYLYYNYDLFKEEPDFIEALCGLVSLDTDQATSVSDVLGLMGPVYTQGGACASGNIALRTALDEIRYHDVDLMMVVGPIFDFGALDLHALALLGAISYQNPAFHAEPQRASRPFDTAREGFVPAHGTAALVVEDYEHAVRRGAHIYAEVLAAAACSDGSHLPQPSTTGQVRAMTRALKEANLRPEDVDFVSAHATSTPLGDVMEIQAIKQVMGDHAYKLAINAPKSMLGHTCWSAPIVESVAGILQMQHSRIHPSINIENLDPAVDLNVCANGPQDRDIRVMMKNSFGFGGINCISLFKRFEE